MQPPPQVVTQRLKNPLPLRFTGDGRKLVTGVAYVSAWRLPQLEHVFRARPLPQPRGFATQPKGAGILCANDLAQFALLDGETGETLATCSDEPYSRDEPFALSACGRFAIYGWRDRARVREIATGELCWERRFDGGYLPTIHSVLDGQMWALQFAGPWNESSGRRNHLEFWSWPFDAEPQRLLPLPNGMYVTAVSRTGRVAVTGSRGRGVTVVQVYDESGALVAEQPTHYMDRVIAWIDDDRFALANDDGVQIRAARTAELVRSIALRGYNRYGCAFGPNGDGLAVSYWEKGFVYIRGALDSESAATRIDDPWPAKRKHAVVAALRPNHWYQTPRAAITKSIAAATIDELHSQLHEFRRRAWLPTIAAAEDTPTASKFGGTPFIAAAEGWPKCVLCGDWLQLALQLADSDLPPELRDSFAGTLQAFFCTSESCRPAEPFAPTTLVRLIEPSGAPAYAAPPFDEAFFARRIVGWQEAPDYPTADELETLGVRLADGPEIGGEFYCSLMSDKLMGWPAWTQSPNYAKCPRCGSPLRALVQIVSEGNVPFMFGDAGTAWVWQCPEHRDVLTFYYSY